MARDYQQFSPLAAMSYVQQQGDIGRERGQRNQLSQLAGLAYSAPREQRDAIGSQLASLSPDAAIAQKKAWAADDESDQKELMGMARFIKAAPPEQQQKAYQNAVLPRLRARGMDAPDWTPETQGTILQTVDALAQAYQGANGGTIQSQKVSDDGYIINTYRDGRMEKTQQKVDRQMWLRDHPGMDPQLVGKDGSVQLVGQPSPAGLTPDGFSVAGEGAGQVRVNLDGMDPQRQNRVAQTVSMMQQAGYPDEEIEQFVQAQISQPVTNIGTPRNAAPRQSLARPSAAQEAGASERAKLQAQLDYLPQQQAIETRGAIDRAVGTERGKAQVEREAAAPGAIATMQASLKSIDELLDSPDLDSIVGWGSINPVNKLPNSPARGLISRAEQIGGQAFLAAFNQLKGGGAITEREGAAATAAMARLDRSQSLEDYRTALKDLRAAITPAISRQREVLSGQQQPATGQPSSPNATRTRIWNPKTREVLELQNGQWMPVQ